MSDTPNKKKHIKSAVKKTYERDPRNYVYANHISARKMTAEKLPKKHSLKKQFPPVFDQEYGSCTSNAALGCDAYYYHPGSKSKWVPSGTFTYYNQRALLHEEDEDSGSNTEFALKMIRKYGACNSKVWPNTKPFAQKPSKEAYADGLKGHEITKYYEVKTLLQVKKALSSGYPVVGSFFWPDKMDDCKSDYSLPYCSKKECWNSLSGHAIVIVGYDDTKKRLEIRNSWGPDWGKNGYAYMSYKLFENAVWWDDIYAVIK